MENCFETPQENANFEDSSCRIEKLNESYLILKQKICRSHELIRQYNDKLKECERSKAELATANKEVKRITGSYTASLAKVIKIELQNTEYNKTIEELELKITKYERKMVEDQQHVQQLVSKMKDMDGKHMDRILKYDLQISALQGKVKELEQELKTTKKLYASKPPKPSKNTNDVDGSETAETKTKTVSKITVDIGINTVTPWPVPVAKPQTADACSLTDEFYNTSYNPYPLFCEKCEVLLQPPPLEKICRVMKECPTILQELSSPPKAAPIQTRVPSVTPPTATSPLQPAPFPQTIIPNNSVHGTPVSFPPPSPPPVMEKVVDQRPLVRMLMKRVNRLETRIDAQSITRNQLSDCHCRSACLGDTISSVSEFLRGVTRIAEQRQEESTRNTKREPRVRVIRSHILRPKLMVARSRLPAKNCSGSWQVNSLKKIQNAKGNKVRKRDMRKLFAVSSELEKAMRKQIPVKPATSRSSLLSLSDSEASNSVSSSDNEHADDQKKGDASVTMDDADSSSSSDENEHFDDQKKVSADERNEHSAQTTIDQDASPVDNENAVEDHSDHESSEEEVQSNSSMNHPEVEPVINKDATVSNTSNINTSCDVEVPPIGPESPVQEDSVNNTDGECSENMEASVLDDDGTEKIAAEETLVLSDKLFGDLCTSDEEDVMSPPSKIIRMSTPPASPDGDMNAYTEKKDPVTIPTEPTISPPRWDKKLLDTSENCVKPTSKENPCETKSQVVPEIDAGSLPMRINMAIQKISTPHRSILVPIRRVQRPVKAEKVVRPQVCQQKLDIHKIPAAIPKSTDNKCSNAEVKSNQPMEIEQTLPDDLNKQPPDDNTDFPVPPENPQRTCENADVPQNAERNDVGLLTPMQILQNHVNNSNPAGKAPDSKQTKKKKRKKAAESIDLTNKFVKKQFQRVIDSKWQLSLHNDIVEKLSKTCSARIIAKLAIEYLSDLASSNKKLDKSLTPPAPLMTKVQQRIVTLLVDLDRLKPGLIRHVQTGIQYKLFRLNCAPERNALDSLGRTYAVLARIVKDREILRIFCCDALYCLGLNAIYILYAAVTCWPEVFPVRRENESDNEMLPQCIAYLILQQQAAAHFPKLLPLKNLITGLYKYTPAQLTKTDLLKALLSSLENKNEDGLYTAVILFAKKEGPAWTYQHIVRQGLLPLIIGQRHPCMYAAFCLLGNLMRSFPVADPDGTVREIVDQLCDLMNSGEGSDEQQEGIASALLSLSRHRFDSAAQSVLAWQSKTPLKPRSVEQLRVLFNSKSVEFWRSFIRRTRVDPCMK